MADAALSLLIAIPTTLEQFLQAVADRRDYVQRYADDPGQHWMRKGGYRESVAEPMQALAAQASQAGVQVVTNARLTNLASATTTSSIVVLFGHWKGAAIAPRDVGNANARALSAALATRDDPEMRHLGKALLRIRDGSSADIARCMNASLIRMQKRTLAAARRSRGVSRISVHPQTAMSRARLALDEALHGLVRPGERLELADGLHSAVQIERELAPGFSGVLDLTTCTSMILADDLDRMRGGTVRCVQFEQRLPPDIAALALRQTFSTLKSYDPFDYLETRKAALRAVAHAIETEAAAQMKRQKRFGFGRKDDQAAQQKAPR